MSYTARDRGLGSPSRREIMRTLGLGLPVA
jgi:hypothetical protein